MTQMVFLTNTTVNWLAHELAVKIKQLGFSEAVRIFGIPRGGIPATYLVKSMLHGTNVYIADNPTEADIFVDDIIDSGSTMQKWCDKYPGKPFFALIDKTDPNCQFLNDWVVFPWEGSSESSIEDNIVRLLQYVGEDPARGGLQETPTRVAKAWKFWTSGYGKDPKEILKTFEDGAEGCDEMVIVKDIPFYTHCEHHLAPFFGTATVAYIPNGKVVGLSKISRIVDLFARRLQVQERLTNQVADTIFDGLDAKGTGVIIKARHLCMESRGLCQQGHHTITSALRGVLKDKPDARAEFMTLAK